MEQSTGIERIRTATFTVARRGYEKREVEQFLNRIADWLETGGGDQARSDIVKRELERVGQRTASILATAEESAEEIRADAEAEAAEVAERADAAARATRAAADDYARTTRETADEIVSDAEHRARELVGAAEAKARRIVEEGTARRRDIETVIADLVERRDAVIAEVNRLAEELRAVSDGHAPERGSDRFAEPRELDPDQRVEA